MDIWGVQQERFKKAEKDAIESVEYKDVSNNIWKLHRTDEGIFFGFFGDPHEKKPFFEVFIDSYVVTESGYEGGLIHINNTGRYFIDSTTFKAFITVRDILKRCSTKAIWKKVEKMFEERLQFDTNLLDCELRKKP
jgi:hypothetical protein